MDKIGTSAAPTQAWVWHRREHFRTPNDKCPFCEKEIRDRKRVKKQQLATQVLREMSRLSPALRAQLMAEASPGVQKALGGSAPITKQEK